MNFASLKAEVGEWDRECQQELWYCCFHYTGNIIHFPTAAVTGQSVSHPTQILSL